MSEQDKNETRPQPPMETPPIDRPPEPAGASSDDFYVEPMTMGGKDVIGIILALVALAIIGYSGYVWLNPNLSYHDILHRGKPAPAAEPMAAAPAPAQSQSTAADKSDMSGMPGMSDAASSQSAAESADTDCANCGMDTLKSMSHIIATWSDGKVTHHDCWSCLFTFAKEYKKTLASAQVRDYRSPTDKQVMLDAAQAWYLYDTKTRVEGSMPPYVAAFPARADAETNRAKLGGEVVDFTQLKAKLLQGSK